MNTTYRALSAVALLSAVTLGTGACSGGAAKPTAVAPAATATASTTPTAPPVPSGPLGPLSGSQIAGKATAGLLAASSVHVTGLAADAAEDNMQMSIDLRVLPGKGYTGTFSTLGSNVPERLLVIGSTVWVLPSTAFWQSTPSLRSLEGKYLQNPNPSTGEAAVSIACDLRAELNNWQSTAAITKGAATTLDGQKVVPLTNTNGTVDVTDTAAPRIVQIALSNDNGSTMTFSGYDATPAVLTAPPASETMSFPI